MVHLDVKGDSKCDKDHRNGENKDILEQDEIEEGCELELHRNNSSNNFVIGQAISFYRAPNLGGAVEVAALQIWWEPGVVERCVVQEVGLAL